MQGLSLSLMGITITFAALGLLILAMIVLERLFRTRKLVPEERSPEETPVASTLARDTQDEEIVAAITVALAYLRSLEIGRSELGMTLEAGHGGWWTAGRVQQRQILTRRRQR